MNLKFLPFALAVLLAPALFAQDYAILLARPLKAGDQQKISVTAKMSQSTTQTVGAAAPQEQKQEVTVQFEGVEKVIEVDANGKETKVSLTVGTFTQTVAGAASDVVPKDTVIACSVADGKPVFEIDGKGVEPGIAQALGMVVDLSHGQHTDDELFGTKEHKKKGDSWDVNAALAKADIEAAASGIEFSDMTGKATLDDVADGALKISVHVTAKVKPPLPPQLTVDDSSLTATLTGSFPVDASKYPPEESQDMLMTFTAHADDPSAGKVVVKTTVDQSVTRKVTPIK